MPEITDIGAQWPKSGILTVIVDKVCDSNAKQRAVKPTEEPTHTLGINDLLDRLKCGHLSLLAFNLCPCR